MSFNDLNFWFVFPLIFVPYWFIKCNIWRKVHSGMIRYYTRFLILIDDDLIERTDTDRGFTPLQGVYEREYEKIDSKSIIDEFKLIYIQ